MGCRGENDGFFDHVPPPIPDPAKYPEEYVKLPSPKGTPGGGLPIGAGFRVPAMVISAWTVGGQVFHEVSGHTSCLRLIEAVAAAGGLDGKGPVTFSNISRWRRTTFGDFTKALQPGAPKPAPTNTQFDAATTAANLAAQQTAARQPVPPRPGATQQKPSVGVGAKRATAKRSTLARLSRGGERHDRCSPPREGNDEGPGETTSRSG